MSWPTDGEPRYKYVETTGFRINPRAVSRSRKATEGLEALVLDRAHCHRIVGRWASEERVGQHGLRLGHHGARKRARDLAATLNAG